MTSPSSPGVPDPMCSACPVDVGECPDCGTFWSRSGGKRYGMRPASEDDARLIRNLQLRNGTAGIVYRHELPNAIGDERR